jgi:DNA-binding response OmpR family regulator
MLPQRILVVDDDPVFSGVAAAALGRAGFRIRTARDGAEGLELLACERFDLVIIDLQTPCIDGLRLVALLRGAWRHQRLAILAVSDWAARPVLDEARAVGADACQVKPVDWAVLPRRVEAMIETRRRAFPLR